MAFPELTAFLRHLETTASTDRDEHELNIGRLRELNEYVRSKDLQEVSACLDAAQGLLEMLARDTALLDRSELQRVVVRTLLIADEAIGRDQERARRATAQSVPDVEFDLTVGDEPAAKTTAPAPVANTLPDEGEPAPAETPQIHDMVLGKMLVELGHATREQVAGALKLHRKMGLPIGECMLMSGAASPDALLETLELQRKLRSGEITPDGEESAADPFAELDRKMRAKNAEMMESYGTPPAGAGAGQKPKAPEAGMRVSEEMFLGEVLLGAGMISNVELEKAMHIHHLEGLMIGQSLLKIGALTAPELESGLELQRKLRHAAGLKGL